MEKDKKHKLDKTGSRIEEIRITDELQESYIDYAMSVMVSRALPDIRDGLKPVHRRILWAMWDMGLKSDSKFVKSARVVGETLGKYHPHGDSAVYDSMVRMAQDFSLRYPLVEGQGNFGNIDGDNSAAQRYTEARMSKIAEEMLRDIEKETIDWRPNYDNSKEEPQCLPAALPNLIINGTMGIAVGMATSIPPHNLSEVAEAIEYLASNPDATVKDLMEHVPAPDFPTGGIIYGRDNLEEAYSTGRGSITVRAVTDIEEMKGGFQIVVTEIPYQVVKSSLIEKIASLVQNKKIEGIKDIRDESDREGLRFVVEIKRGANPNRVLNQLFKHTDLQKNFYFNMVALVDKIQPQTVSLKDILSAYLSHRKEVVKRRTQFDLNKAEERAHILEGLVIALQDIDKVIATIKKSKDKADAHKKLVKQFKLTSVQTDAILEMRLQSLASLEAQKIKDELKEKKEIIKELKAILKSEERMVEVVTEELKNVKDKFGDERRTKIAESKLKEFKKEDFVAKEKAIIMLTQDGYIKRIPPASFKSQGRGGKGLIGFDLKEEDRIYMLLTAGTHDNAYFFTNKGKIYKTKVYEIPKTSRTAKGKLVHTFLGLSDDEKVTTLVTSPEKDIESSYFLMLTEQGKIKRTSLDNFENIRSNGITAIKIGSKDQLKWVRIVSDKDQVAVISKKGQSIRFDMEDVRPMGRTAAGVKAISLKKGDVVAGIGIIKEGIDEKENQLLVVMEKGFGKRTPIKEYKTQSRGGSGVITAKTSNKTGDVITAKIVGKDIEEILALSAKGKVIRMNLKTIRSSGRSTQGVKIMSLGKDDYLVGMVTL